jgi:predicted nucleic acid-binding protein
MAERCIDANVAIKWFIKGEAFRRTALRLLRESLLAGITLIVPPFFESETDGIIQTRLVEGRTTPEVADRTFVLLDSAPNRTDCACSRRPIGKGVGLRCFLGGTDA